MRRSIVDQLMTGSLFSYIREDLLHLLDKIDDIADNVKDAARLLAEYAPSKKILIYLFNLDDMGNYIDSVYKSDRILNDSLAFLNNNSKEALRLLKDVEKYEEEGDLYKVRILKKLYEDAKKFSVLDVIKLRDFIILADNIADAAEDAGDIMMELIAKGLS